MRDGTPKRASGSETDEIPSPAPSRGRNGFGVQYSSESEEDTDFLDKRSVGPVVSPLLKLFPGLLLSRMSGMLGRVPLPYPLNLLLIRVYSFLYGVNLSESERSPSQYSSLQSFFTRRLRAELRPLDPDPRSLLSPVDGQVVRVGEVQGGSLLQVKGWRYTLEALLKDPMSASRFSGGTACTLYLSPADCHRIYMPLDGTVVSLRYVPGKLYPVNRFFLKRIPNLFVMNERVILNLETRIGPVIMVLVGATNVGKIRIRFDPVRRLMSRGGPFQRSYRPGISLKRGEEVGCFELGSTVILLFEKDRVQLTLEQGARTRIHEKIGFIS